MTVDRHVLIFRQNQAHSFQKRFPKHFETHMGFLKTQLNKLQQSYVFVFFTYPHMLPQWTGPVDGQAGLFTIVEGTCDLFANIPKLSFAMQCDVITF